MCALDIKKLCRDVAYEQRTRTERVTSGSMRTIRENLATIEQLRATGASWNAIATSLAAQGVTLRNGQPITAKRLTALLDSIKRQDAKRRARAKARTVRIDVVPLLPSTAQHGRVGLAAELRAHQTEAPDQSGSDEESIRRQQLAATRDLMKVKE